MIKSQKKLYFSIKAIGKRKGMKGRKKNIITNIISLGIASAGSIMLFLYLSETIIQWRIIFSVLLFFAAFIMVEGFSRRV